MLPEMAVFLLDFYTTYKGHIYPIDTVWIPYILRKRRKERTKEKKNKEHSYIIYNKYLYFNY